MKEKWDFCLFKLISCGASCANDEFCELSGVFSCVAKMKPAPPLVQMILTQRTLLIQRKKNRSKCRLIQEAFYHRTLYVCVTLPINPFWQPASQWDLHHIPLAIVGTFLTQHYSVIPTMCGFSRAECSLHGPWRIPLSGGDQLLVITTRLQHVYLCVGGWGDSRSRL